MPVMHRSTTQMKLDALSAAGFETSLERPLPKRLVVCTSGHWKSGKTHWAVITAPEPLAVISFDPGTIEIVEKGRRMGRKIHHRPHRIPRPKAGVSIEKRKDIYGPAWDEVKESVEAIIGSPDIRTAVWDTGTEAWELCRLAGFGKIMQVKPQHYGPVNDDFRSLVKGMYDERPDLNIIFIHKLKKEYRESKGKSGDANWTGRYELAGFGDMPFIVDLNVEHDFDPTARQFIIRVPAAEGNCGCRFGPHMVGFELPGEAGMPVDFATLAMEAIPDSRPEDWE